MSTTTVWRPTPQWLRLLLAVVITVVVMVAALVMVNAVINPGNPGQAYLDALHEAAPAGVSIDDPVVLASATKACEAGDAGTLGLQQALVGLGYAPSAVLNQIMPAHAAYCAAR